jgi:hypothetical protein
MSAKIYAASDGLVGQAILLQSKKAVDDKLSFESLGSDNHSDSISVEAAGLIC